MDDAELLASHESAVTPIERERHGSFNFERSRSLILPPGAGYERFYPVTARSHHPIDAWPPGAAVELRLVALAAPQNPVAKRPSPRRPLELLLNRVAVCYARFRSVPPKPENKPAPTELSIISALLLFVTLPTD
jgi:hypothetical protein